MVHERASVFMGELFASASRMLGNATKNGPACCLAPRITFCHVEADLSMQIAPNAEWPKDTLVWVWDKLTRDAT
jgi:hypothetical protein